MSTIESDDASFIEIGFKWFLLVWSRAMKTIRYLVPTVRIHYTSKYLIIYDKMKTQNKNLPIINDTKNKHDLVELLEIPRLVPICDLAVQ